MDPVRVRRARARSSNRMKIASCSNNANGAVYCRRPQQPPPTHSLQLLRDSQPPGTAPLVSRHVVTPQPSSAQSCCCVLAWMMALLFIASFQRPPTSELPCSSTRASLQLYQQPGCCQQSGCDCPGQNQSTVHRRRHFEVLGRDENVGKKSCTYCSRMPSRRGGQ